MPLTEASAYRKDMTGLAPMQHRHFKTIATIIRDLDPSQRADVAHHFSAYLRRTNPNFDRDRFIRASLGDDPSA